jgi:hypothetical protein
MPQLLGISLPIQARLILAHLILGEKLPEQTVEQIVTLWR